MCPAFGDREKQIAESKQSCTSSRQSRGKCVPVETFSLGKISEFSFSCAICWPKSQETLEPIYSIWKLVSDFIAFNFCSRADSVSKERSLVLCPSRGFFVFCRFYVGFCWFFLIVCLKHIN